MNKIVRKAHKRPVYNPAEIREAQKILAEIENGERKRAHTVKRLAEERIAKSKISTDELRLWAARLRKEIREILERNKESQIKSGSIHVIGRRAELRVVEGEIKRRGG